MKLMAPRMSLWPMVVLLTVWMAEAQVSFIVSSAAASPNTAHSFNAQYTIVLNAITTFSSTFDTSISFTSAFSITSVTGCQALLNGATISTAQCIVSSNSIIFTQLGISTTVNNLTFTFNTSTALYSGSFIATLTYYQAGNSSNTYNTNSALITIANAAMSCSLTSSSTVVGATTNYSLTYTPGAYISSGSVLQVVFPAWSAYTLTNFPSFTSASVCGGLCSIRSPNTGQGLLNQILTYSTLYSANTNSSNTLMILNARNPASTQSISLTLNFLYFISSTSQPAYMTCTTSFAATTAGTLTSVSFTPSNTSISATNTVSLLLALANPISSISYLSIAYGSDLQLSFTFATSSQGTTATTFSSGIANTLLIGNLTNSPSSFTTLFMASFTLINAPYAGVSNSITFLTENLASSVYYSIDTKAISLTSVVSTILTATVTLSNASIGIVSNLTLSFTSVNSLVSGSLVIITLPSQISLSSGSSTCSCSISSTCSLFNSTSIIINIQAITVTGGSNFAITVSSVSNPLTTTTTSPFIITTYYKNTSTPVDTLYSGLTLTANPAALFSAAVASSSLTVAANSTYTFTVQNRNPLPAGGYLIITFPSNFQNSAGATLSSFQSGSNVISSCTMLAISTMTFNFTSCVPNTLAAQTTTTITLTKIINPLSTKPTSSFSILTFYNNNEMEYVTSGMIVTMTTPTQLSFISFTPSNTITNAVTTYTMAITFAEQHYSGDHIVITIPTAITLNSGFTCGTGTSGLSVSCFQLSTQVLQITMTSSATIPFSISVTITNLQNNWYSGSSTFSLETTTNDTSGTYYVQSGSASVTMTPSALSVAYTPTNSLVLLSTSTLTITITSPFTISAPSPTLLKIIVTVPSQLTPTGSCSGSLSGSVCSFSGSIYTLTNLSSFTSSVNLTFSVTTSYFTTSSAFSSVLSYNNSNIATDNTFTISPYCTSPCMACTTTATQCSSCLPTPYTSFNDLYTPNSSCLTACPGGYFLPSSSFTCSQCNTSACLNCSGTAITCTSCSSPRFFINSSCVLTCPNTYYGSGTLCVPCINQCFNCSNATSCLSCVSGYSLNPNFTCQSGCPTNYISISSVCQICTSPCQTCSNSVTNCTNCVADYILYNNTCILACPLGFYEDSNGNCDTCISPCKFCTTALLCTSCVNNNYLYNGTECVSTCPAGYYSVASNCQSCTSPCQTCNNTATNCTSCISGQSLYVGTCYSTCPTLTYPYQGICTTCVSPCSTCLNGAFSCSTCISGYVLLNTSCVSACPSSGYVTINSDCVACPTNCISCTSSTACSGCGSGYFQYQGSCVSSCPSSSAIVVNQVCMSCSSECATCQNSSDNCLTCTIYYYRYSYTCVLSCPLAYYSDPTTFTCESGLSSKIVFFPVFITYLVVIFLLIMIKIFARSTSLPTSITSLSGWLELAIWCYLISLIFGPSLEPGINYPLPQALILIAIFTSLICNIVHFKVNDARLQQDDYVKQWDRVNVNHTYLVAIRYISLCSSHKFFRIIYSKIFHSIHFSMVALRPANMFSVSTAFSLASLILAELPVMVGAFYLAYNKLLKDQVFYTSVQALIVTVISIIFSLVDIYKPKDYFEDTEFMETKRYLDKVNNDSLNKLEDQYHVKDESSVDGEKVVAFTGGKFIFSKGPSAQRGSMNELLFEEQSAATDANNLKQTMKMEVEGGNMQDDEGINEKSLNSSNSMTGRSDKKSRSQHSKRARRQGKINIFEPIQQEDAQYYEGLKYEQEDFKTAAKMERQKIDGNASEEDNELESVRRNEFGLNEPQPNIIDDNMSLLQYRQRRQQWNEIIDHRQKLAQKIFNTIDVKELYRIQEPLNEDEDIYFPIKQRIHNRRSAGRMRRLKEGRQQFEYQLKQTKLNKNIIKISQEQDYFDEQLPRKRKSRKNRRGNKKLQEIYLQRLAEKVRDPKHKNIYASSKTFKYQF